MNNYVLSNDAEGDIIDIYLYTLKNFGLSKADDYIGKLEQKLHLTASCPDIGKNCDMILKGSYRLEHESHSIYYRLMDDGIFIFRILHQRMDPHKNII